MKIIELIGDRLLLDYLITQNFNFTYQDDKVDCGYSSNCFISDNDNKLNEIEPELANKREIPDTNPSEISEYEDAIAILNTLKVNLNN